MKHNPHRVAAVLLALPIAVGSAVMTSAPAFAETVCWTAANGAQICQDDGSGGQTPGGLGTVGSGGITTPGQAPEAPAPQYQAPQAPVPKYVAPAPVYVPPAQQAPAAPAAPVAPAPVQQQYQAPAQQAGSVPVQQAPAPVEPQGQQPAAPAGDQPAAVNPAEQQASTPAPAASQASPSSPVASMSPTPTPSATQSARPVDSARVSDVASAAGPLFAALAVIGAILVATLWPRRRGNTAADEETTQKKVKE